MGSITILRIDCIAPSTGVASWFETCVNAASVAFFGAVGGAIGGAAGEAAGAAAGGALGGASGVATGPAAEVMVPAGVIVGAAAGSVVGTTLGVAIGGAAGSAIGAGVAAASNSAMEYVGQHIRDQLYVEADGDAIWPIDGQDGVHSKLGTTPTIDIKGGDSVLPNVEIPFGSNGTVTIKLKEWDNISDDNLGQMTFSADSEGGMLQFSNSDESDIYYVWVQINP